MSKEDPTKTFHSYTRTYMCTKACRPTGNRACWTGWNEGQEGSGGTLVLSPAPRTGGGRLQLREAWMQPMEQSPTGGSTQVGSPRRSDSTGLSFVPQEHMESPFH